MTLAGVGLLADGAAGVPLHRELRVLRPHLGEEREHGERRAPISELVVCGAEDSRG